MPNVRIWVAPDADKLQLYAAAELRGYLDRLFGMPAEVVTSAPAPTQLGFVLGLADAGHVRSASRSMPRLSAQGHFVRRTGPARMVLAGGSSAAVAWAVYELVERYGVRYLLHEDVLPKDPGPFHLPDVDAVLEPLVALRLWDQFNDLPTGPALWSLAEQRAFIRQVFKLKLNGLYLSVWPQHPFVDYQVPGIKRQSAAMLFGQKIPIDADNIGRRHLPDAPFLNNPEMLKAHTYAEMLEAGRSLLTGILEEARALGMHTAISLQPMEFPLEFRGLLQHPTDDMIQLGRLTCAEQGDLLNPGHTALIRAILDAYLDQWGQVDELRLDLPEHHKADANFLTAWRELDRRYRLEAEFPLESFVAQARSSYLTAGGAQRAERELKSTIAMLRFFDRLFATDDYLERAAKKGVAVKLDLGAGAAPLLPVVGRVLWEGSGVGIFLGYTSSRAVRSMRYMEGLDAERVSADLVLTLQDDNIGWLPQVATENIHVLLRAVQRLGWRGYITRHWPIGDLDPVVAYLSRASWDARTTPRAAYEDHFTHLFGGDATEDLCQVMRILEDATVILDLDFLSLFFPVLGIMCRSIEGEQPMPVGLFHVRAMYEECRRILARQQSSSMPPAGQAHLAYVASRLDFAVQALVEKELLSEGGVQIREARAAGQAGDEAKAAGHLARAQELFQQGLAAGEAALEAAARHLRDDSDRASLAAYYHFFVREVRERAAGLLARNGSTPAGP